MRTPTAAPPLDRHDALFLDVDGTLLDIAPRPELVEVLPSLPDLLQHLGGEREGALALISGRPIAELDRLFRPWRGAAAGLHGIERRRPDGSYAPGSDADADRAAAAALGRLRPEMTAIARRWPGVFIEDKGRTLALHYRAVPEAEMAIRDAAARLLEGCDDSLRLIAGNKVIEFQPRHHDKGRVIAAFMTELPFQGRRPVYLGDDTTDEDGFAEVNRRGGVSIRIGGQSGSTAAVFALSSARSAIEWLAGAWRAAAT